MYKIFDLHNDYFLKIKKDKNKQKYLSSNANLAENIISAIWTSELSCDESLREIERARDFVNSQKNIFLAVEDLHFLSEKTLKNFVSMRPIYAGLTWNTANCLAGGAHESGKITNFGKKVIKELEENDIKIDTAHLNEDSFMGVSKLTKNDVERTSFFCIYLIVWQGNDIDSNY